MITITSSAGKDNRAGLMEDVEKEIDALNRYLIRRKMDPTMKVESSMIREYILAKIHGELDEEPQGVKGPQDNP